MMLKCISKMYVIPSEGCCFPNNELKLCATVKADTTVTIYI